MNWREDFLLEGDSPEVALRGQFQLAMYAIHLSLGNSIYCRAIRAATIEQYVLALAMFLMHFTGVDFRKDRPGDSHFGHILAPVFKELRRYDALPNKKEPYNATMHRAGVAAAGELPRDHLIPALVDGFAVGYLAGHRLSEWAQPGSHHDVTRPQLGEPDVNPHRTRALVPNDVRILTHTRDRAVGLAILDTPVESIARLWLKWRYQKNQQNGIEKLFVPNPDPHGICCVRAVYSSLSRFARLRARDNRLDPWVTPLSVYWNPRVACVRLINAHDIETFMRRLAASVYHLDPVVDAADLKRWSSRSLRIGACVTLHTMGFTPLDIQWILRWRSTAFMEYLRNTPTLSGRQVEAYNRAGAMPCL